MSHFNREIEQTILKNMIPNKVIVLIGPRRVGKTFLIEQLIKKIKEPYLLFSGEDIRVLELLKRRSVQNYEQVLKDRKLLIIDEAQKIPDIGLILKLMVDQIKGLKIIITGSSAFDIHNYTGEPLTGREISYKLYALSEKELSQNEHPLERKDNLHQRLIYGNYPEIINIKNLDRKTKYLKEIVHSYLQKEILAFENIRNSDKILDLLKLIAYQIGREVSLQELGAQLSMSKNTVEKYLDLLTKVFVIHNVKGFSRNLRKEIVKNSKWYFYDNGLRNILIANTSPIQLRQDVSQLWENYIISERIKYQSNQNMLVNNYFWRTYDQQEIDWIEDRGGKLYGYEFKWNSKKKIKAPGAWTKNYLEASYEVVSPDNYLTWLEV